MSIFSLLDLIKKNDISLNVLKPCSEGQKAGLDNCSPKCVKSSL